MEDKEPLEVRGSCAWSDFFSIDNAFEPIGIDCVIDYNYVIISVVVPSKAPSFGWVVRFWVHHARDNTHSIAVEAKVMKSETAQSPRRLRL